MEEIKLKKCTKCGEYKKLEEFSNDKTKKDGLYSSCKKCKYEQDKKTLAKRNSKEIKKYHREYYHIWINREGNRKKIREQSRLRHRKNPEIRRNALNKYIKNNKEHYKISHKKYYINNKVKRYAKLMVHLAVKLGVIKRPSICQKCHKKCKPSGHHKDYSKPLEVIWLCGFCHGEEHQIKESI